ncbi:MAG: alpha/beta fold hydrolase, partial [Smithella sp.]
CFVMRQITDIFSPSNFILTNPVVTRVTIEEGGSNLINGFNNFLDDWKRLITEQKPAGVENFKPGKQVAATKGKVVLRNRLIELIQYSPSTDKVYKEPVLIIPAWIMKYYILDLSPNNSLVKYLVDKGHTVFMISWKNPDSRDRDIGLNDYVKIGAFAALDAVSAIIPDTKIHTLGYCLGGTLLAIAAAAMAREGDNRLQSMTLLAAQTDFKEAGELMLFIDENQVDFLEDLMWDQGYLDTAQMAGTFQMLRSKDLIWSKMVNDYLFGQRRPMIDLFAWNADATRMPYYMHSQYLRRLFLDNELSSGRYTIDDKTIVLTDIHVPVFLVATIKDHVAPWRSVYKFHLYSDAPEVVFALTSGGHNAGIVNEPSKSKRTYQIGAVRGGKYIDPDTWQETTPSHPGSWWVPWEEWLAKYSNPEKVDPPPVGNPEKGYYPLIDAPGIYILET